MTQFKEGVTNYGLLPVDGPWLGTLNGWVYMGNTHRLEHR